MRDSAHPPAPAGTSQLFVRPLVLAFAHAMERKLRAHDEKRGDSWTQEEPDWLWRRAQEEWKELNTAIGETLSEDWPHGRSALLSEAADVANFLAFLAHQTGALTGLIPSKESSPSGTPPTADATGALAYLRECIDGMREGRDGDGVFAQKAYELIDELSSPAGTPREPERFTEAEWEGLVWSLSSRAEFLAARYGAPVHLVGSALNWREKAPNDIDIRIVLPDADWEARFGGNSLHFNAECSPAYVAEVGKMTRQLVRDLQRNIDFQVQPENWLTRHNAHDKPRLLLADCVARSAVPDAGEVSA